MAAWPRLAGGTCPSSIRRAYCGRWRLCAGIPACSTCPTWAASSSPGSGSTAFLDKLLSANVTKLRRGRSRYHVICDEAGGIIDDAIVYNLGKDHYLLIVNAGNFDAVSAWLATHSEGVPDFESEVTTEDVAMIAVQGPNAVGLTESMSDSPVSSLRPFAITGAEIAGIPCRVARTGYTGEDGFEIMPPADGATSLWIGPGRGRRGTLRARRTRRAPARGGTTAARQRHDGREQPIRGRSRTFRLSRLARLRSGGCPSFRQGCRSGEAACRLQNDRPGHRPSRPPDSSPAAPGSARLRQARIRQRLTQI